MIWLTACRHLAAPKNRCRDPEHKFKRAKPKPRKLCARQPKLCAVVILAELLRRNRVPNKRFNKPHKQRMAIVAMQAATKIR